MNNSTVETSEHNSPNTTSSEKNTSKKFPALLIGFLLNAVMGVVSYKLLLPAFINVILSTAMEVTISGLIIEILKGFAPIFIGAIAINLVTFFLIKKHIRKKWLYLFLTALFYIIFVIATFMLFEIIGY